MRQTITLEQISIPEPCHADWGAMTGDDRSRFCGSCQKHVFDLSARTRAEAELLLTERAGHLCVQFRKAADGRIITSDTPAPSRWAWGGFSMLVAFALSLIGCGRDTTQTIAGAPLPGEVMVRTAGMVAMPQTQLRGDVMLPATQPTTQPISAGASSTPMLGSIAPTTQPMVRGKVAADR